MTSASLEEKGIVRSSAVGFGPRVGQERVVQLTRGPWGVLRRLQRRRSDAVGVRERCCHMCFCALCVFSSSCCVGRGGGKGTLKVYSTRRYIPTSHAEAGARAHALVVGQRLRGATNGSTSMCSLLSSACVRLTVTSARSQRQGTQGKTSKRSTSWGRATTVQHVTQQHQKPTACGPPHRNCRARSTGPARCTSSRTHSRRTAQQPWILGRDNSTGHSNGVAGDTQVSSWGHQPAGTRRRTLDDPTARALAPFRRRIYTTTTVHQTTALRHRRRHSSTQCVFGGTSAGEPPGAYQFVQRH